MSEPELPDHDEHADSGSPEGFYNTLLRCEWTEPHILAKFQENSVKKILQHAIRHVPYHRDRLGFLLDGNGNINLSRWLAVPTMSRPDVERNYQDLIAEEVPKSHGEVLTASTSASHGRPLVLKKTRLHDTAIACASFRHARTFDLDWARPLVLIRALAGRARRPSDTATAPPKWGPDWMDPEQRGERVRMSVHTPLARQIERLCEMGPTYLNTSPANAMALAAFVARHPEKRPAILALLTVGEYVSQDTRRECREHLGCELIDVFSTAECGVIATQCPEHGGYHMQPELTVLEILDQKGKPCRPGETGRITATPLYNYAMPLVRYQSEDYATVGGSCACGRPAPILSKVLGRSNHHFVLPDGRYVRPEPSSSELRQFIGFRRWQLVQTGTGQAEFRVSAGPGGDPLDAEAAEAYISSIIEGEFAVRVIRDAILGPTSGGKFASVLRDFGEHGEALANVG